MPESADARVLEATAPPVPEWLLRRWEKRGQRTPQELGWVLDVAAEDRPEAEAIVLPGDRCTFRELSIRADAIAAQLVDAGIRRGEVVAWTLPNSIEATATAAAIWRVGAVSNPIVPIYRERELAHIFGEVRPRVVVSAADIRGRRRCDEVDTALRAAGHEPAGRLVSGGSHPGWGEMTTATSSGSLDASITPASADAPALVLYTSGTTAKPKGVIHSSATLLHEADSMRHNWALTHRDTIVMASPLTHITGMLQGLIVPCLAGARCLLLDRWDPELCVDMIERERGTYMAGSTPFLQGILDVYERRGVAPALRQFCCGGAAVSPTLIERAERLGIAAHRSWGLTEFPSGSLARPTDPVRRRAQTDGHIGEGVEVEAVDDQRRPLPRGAEGELRLRGPERMLGYVDASLNDEVLDRDGWTYSGDLGIVSEDGFVTVTGRLKDIINRGGEKFSAREIEEALGGHPAIRDVAVVALPEERLGELVCAVIEPVGEAVIDPAELSRYLEDQRLARQKIPQRFEVMAELPRTPAGKVQKHVIIAELIGVREPSRTP
jgi:acyl-CoA synthetase (AMP-forming)/AMP-acid ligase II